MNKLFVLLCVFYQILQGHEHFTCIFSCCELIWYSIMSWIILICCMCMRLLSAETNSRSLGDFYFAIFYIFIVYNVYYIFSIKCSEWVLGYPFQYT